MIQLNFDTLPSSSSVADGQSQQITMSQTGHVYLYIGNVLNEWKACNDVPYALLQCQNC